MTESLVPYFSILLVDDEPAWLRSVSLTLARAGINNILTCSDSREVPGILAEGQVKLVLLDLTMPHMDGEATFSSLRNIRPDLPVLLMSGFNENDALSRFGGKGLAGFLQKPFDLANLRQKLAEIVG